MRNNRLEYVETAFCVSMCVYAERMTDRRTLSPNVMRLRVYACARMRICTQRTHRQRASNYPEYPTLPQLSTFMQTLHGGKSPYVPFTIR